MNIKELRNRIYEKYKINVSENDPSFLIISLLIEEGLDVEKERYILIAKQVDEIIKGAAQAAELQNQKLFLATDKTIRDFKKEYEHLIFEIQNSKKDNMSNGKNKQYSIYWNIVILLFLIINSLTLILILFSS